MGKKKIQFSLVYRDMWQSSGKFQPRKDQLERIAPVIIEKNLQVSSFITIFARE